MCLWKIIIHFYQASSKGCSETTNPSNTQPYRDKGDSYPTISKLQQSLSISPIRNRTFGSFRFPLHSLRGSLGLPVVWTEYRWGIIRLRTTPGRSLTHWVTTESICITSECDAVCNTINGALPAENVFHWFKSGARQWSCVTGSKGTTSYLWFHI